MDVIIANPHAKGLKKDRRILHRIHTLFAEYAHIIDADDRHNVIHELNALGHEWCDKDRIFVVGGDGTFSNLLQWIVGLPMGEQPRIMSVGGGQFCYMAHFHRLKCKDPIKNLRRIYSGKLKLSEEDWEPLCVEDSLTRHKRYAAVMATGVVSDVLGWYEDSGKGGILNVIRIILMAIASVLSDSLRRRIGRIHLQQGKLVLGTEHLHPKSYAGVTCSAIPELLSSCRPFKGRRIPYQFYAIAYWGGLRRLALAAPLIWFGWTPFWTRRSTFNDVIRDAHVGTSESCIVLDGDLFTWPGSNKRSRFERTIIVTTGPAIPILVADA